LKILIGFVVACGFVSDLLAVELVLLRALGTCVFINPSFFSRSSTPLFCSSLPGYIDAWQRHAVFMQLGLWWLLFLSSFCF